MKGVINYEEKSIYCNGIFYGSYASNATYNVTNNQQVTDQNQTT